MFSFPILLGSAAMEAIECLALLYQSSGATSPPIHKIQNMLVIDVLMRSFLPIASTHFSDQQNMFRQQLRIVSNTNPCFTMQSSFSWMCLSKIIPFQLYYWHKMQAKPWHRCQNIWWKKELPQDCLVEPLKTQYSLWSINNGLKVPESFKKEYPKQQNLKMLPITFHSIQNNKWFC